MPIRRLGLCGSSPVDANMTSGLGRLSRGECDGQVVPSALDWTSRRFARVDALEEVIHLGEIHVIDFPAGRQRVGIPGVIGGDVPADPLVRPGPSDRPLLADDVTRPTVGSLNVI